MKKLLALLVFTLVGSFAFAQDFEAPQEGAKIYLSDYQLNLGTSDEAQIDIWVVRSKKAKKSKFDAPKFLGTDDLSIEITQDPSSPDHYTAAVKSENVPAGTYFYTVSSRSRSIQKVKGTTVSFTVGAAEVITKNNE